MVELKVLVDNFMVGTVKYAKGSVIKVHVGAVPYCVGNGSCELVVDKPVVKKVVDKKKPTYKTKVMTAE